MNARLTEGKIRRAGAAFLFLLALAACTRKPPAERPPQPGDKAVARINGAPVWASDVKREAVAQGLIGQGEPLDSTSAVFGQVLDEVVDGKLLAAEAIRRRLDKDPAAQRRLGSARERVLGDILLESAVGKAVNGEAVNGLYQEMLRNETPSEELRLRQIVSASQADAEQVKKVLIGGAAFDAVAAERSRDEATRFKGGELAPLTVDMLPEGYAGALKDARAGQLVGPFQAAAGWVVARVDARRQEAPITLEVARPQIIRFLTYDQVKDLVLDLRRRAKVQTLIAPPRAFPGAPPEPAGAPPATPATAKPPARP
ncbi:MAG: peptidylprolyl isomerase [Caulobacteraceae bacterium]|nr:peptidylprolyl isomerase [Caulobacteraceae bacterium]